MQEEPASKRVRRDVANIWISTKPFKTKPGVRRDMFPPELHRYTALNVTSVQGKEEKDRIAFSPMYPPPGGFQAPDGQTFLNFEAFWQSGKVLRKRATNTLEPIAKTRHYWRTIKEPKRSYPGFKKNYTVEYCCWRDGQRLNYLQSRKVYILEYRNYVMRHAPERIAEWQARMRKGEIIVVEDIDGPHEYQTDPVTNTTVAVPVIHAFDEAYFREKFMDEKRPFGHGYVVCAMLVGLDLDHIVSTLPEESRR